VIQAFKTVAIDRSNADRRQIDLNLRDRARSWQSDRRAPKAARTLRIDIPLTSSWTATPGAYRQVDEKYDLQCATLALTDGGAGNILIEAARVGVDEMRSVSTTTESGIPEEIQRHVFDPFVTTPTDESSTGTRPLCRRNIVKEQLGGRNQHHLCSGKGTRLHDSSIGAPGKNGRRGRRLNGGHENARDGIPRRNACTIGLAISPRTRLAARARERQRSHPRQVRDRLRRRLASMRKRFAFSAGNDEALLHLPQAQEGP